MQRIAKSVLVLAICGAIGLIWPVGLAVGQGAANYALCEELAFSTEEDFVTQGPLPPDGNPIISDGDLLGKNGAVCARNRVLLAPWQVVPDLGLDAVDVLEVVDVEQPLVIFSTELNDPINRFGSGDLLSTTGVAIPNLALLFKFDIRMNLGLDAVHMIGGPDEIRRFWIVAGQVPGEQWLSQPDLLVDLLAEYNVDIWFSTEGTAPNGAPVPFLDGDLLSARDGTLVWSQDSLFNLPIPAGIPNRGVDFGLDGATSSRDGEPDNIRFTTEILYRNEGAFTDGDILELGGAVITPHTSLVAPFEPHADFLGIDAFYQATSGDTTGPQSPTGITTYIPIVSKDSN